MNEGTARPWCISLAKTADGETMIVAGGSQSFGLVAAVTYEVDAQAIVTAVNSHDALIAERDKLRASAEKMAEALEPFAKLADVVSHCTHPDRQRLCRVTVNGFSYDGPTVGECRGARAALSQFRSGE